MATQSRTLLFPAIVLALALWSTPGTAINRREGEHILLAHNRARGRVSPVPFPALNSMTWHSTLAIVAQFHSSKCSATPNKNRGQMLSRLFGSVGENLHVSHNTANIAGALMAAVGEWDQPDTYLYESNTCRPGSECGQYTQLIWSATSYMGCGATLCNSRTKKRTTARSQGPKMVLVVCNYAMGGNTFGRRPYSSQTTVFNAAMLAAHNVARRAAWPRPSTPLPPMTWDTRLASVASDYARKCKYIHNKQRHKQVRGAYGYVGENLFLKAGAHGLSEAELAGGIKFWDDEKRDYDLARNACRRNRLCGHYTQLVWNASTRVGCAAELCDAYAMRGVHESMRSAGSTMLLLVCNYGPSGNHQGQRPYVT